MPLLAIFEDGTFDLTAEQYAGLAAIDVSAVIAQADGLSENSFR